MASEANLAEYLLEYAHMLISYDVGGPSLGSTFGGPAGHKPIMPLPTNLARLVGMF
jgi:hypothetical protein